MARWYVRWRGEANEARRIRHDDTAILEIGTWNPMGEGSKESGVDWRPGKLTLRSSIGETDFFLSREAVARMEDYYQRRFTFVIRLLSHSTQRQARYRLQLGPKGASNQSPDVSIERLDTPE